MTVPAPETAIHARGLFKTFRARKKRPGLVGALRDLVAPDRTLVEAVAGIDMTIARGERVGCLGPNGAGKSTTIKMLVGILHPDRGEVLIHGRSPHRERSRVVSEIGVVFGQRTQLQWDLRLGESFELLRRIYRVEPDRAAATVRNLTELLGLDEFIDRPVRTLSLGQRMRGELAAALLHEPTLLLLDEPTIGLDIEAKRAIRSAILQLNERFGTTVLLTSHDLQDVEALCERLIVVNHGRVVADGELKSLVQRLAPQRRLVVECDTIPERIDVAGLVEVRRTSSRVWLDFPRSESPARLISELSRVLPIRDLHLEEPSIEDVVEKLYAGEAKD